MSEVHIDILGRTVLPLEQVWVGLKKLAELRDPELVLLKGHLLVEKVLVAAAASRLGSDDSDLPKLSFGNLVDLIFAADYTIRAKHDHIVPVKFQRDRLVWLNQMRNALAHELEGLEKKAFQSSVALFNLPWPPGALERCLVIETIVNEAHLFAYTRYLMYEMPKALPEIEESIIDPMFELWGNVRALMKDGDWEDLVRVLRASRPRPLSA